MFILLSNIYDLNVFVAKLQFVMFCIFVCVGEMIVQHGKLNYPIHTLCIHHYLRLGQD